MSKNPVRNYAIQWLTRPVSPAEQAAATAAVPATSADATGIVYGDVSGSLLGPLQVVGLLGAPIVGPLADKQTLNYDASEGAFNPANVEDLATAETDTTKRLAPDGSGGLDWVTEAADVLYDTNVKDYGAVGDDTTDDTAAIQAAMDATPNGGTCFLPTPSAKYKITAALTRGDPQGGIRLLGAGTMYGTTTIRQATANTDGFTSAVDVLSTYSPSGIDNSRNYERAINIEQLRFEGPTGSTNAASGSGIYALADLHLRNVTVYGFNDAIYVGAHGYFSHIDHCRVTGATNAGIYFPTGNNLIIESSQFWFCKYGVFMTDFLLANVDECAFEQNTTAGLWAEGKTGSTTTSRSLSVTRCFFEETASGVPDIVLGKTYNLTSATIADCYFQDNAQGDTGSSWHIDVYKTTQLTLSTNRLTGGGSTGGDLRTTSDTTYMLLLNQQMVRTSIDPATSLLRIDPALGIVSPSQFSLSGVISPAQLVANTNDWNPTGLSTAAVIRLSTDASRNLTGISGGAAGRMLILQNVGAQDLVLKHDATSTAANRFYCPNDADVTVQKDAAVWLAYDGTSSRWRIVVLPSGSVTFAAPTGGYGAPAAGVASTAIRSDAVFPKPTEGDISLSAVTTNDVSTSKHGFAPVLPNDATKYLDGTGAYTVPPGTLTAAAVRDVGGHWELMMDPATSSPPVPITTEDGTDWVWGWVTG